MIAGKGVALAAAFRIFLVLVSVLWASAAEFDLVERGYCDVPVYMEEGVAQPMRRSAVANGYAYVCRANDGLLIFDVRDIRAPRMIRKVSVAGASGVEAGDQILFVGGSNGVVVFDLNDPAYPVEVGSCSIEGGVSDLTLAGNTLYVADRPGGLQIVDVTDARQPLLQGRLQFGLGLAKPAVAGGTVIAARWGVPGIHVIDVKDPLNPVRVGGYSTGRDVTSLAAIGSVAFAAERGGGFYLVALDISDPSAPEFLSEYQSQGLEHLTAVGNRIYAAKWIYGIEAFDVSNARALKSQGSYIPDADWHTHTLTLNGGNAFVTATDETLSDRLSIVDFDNGANLERIGRTLEVPLEYAATEGSILCAVTPGTPSTTLRIFRSDGSEALDEVGRCELSGLASSVEIKDGIAYLCLGGPSEGLVARVDATDPRAPRVLESIPTGKGAAGLRVDRGVLYTFLTRELNAFDLSDPTWPHLSTYRIAEDAHWGPIRDGFAYMMANYRSFRIVDVRDARRPTEIGSFSVSGYFHPPGMLMAGSAVIIATSDGVAAIDVSNPSAPRMASRIRLSHWIYMMSVNGRYLYAASYPGRIHVVDISNPNRLMRVGGGGVDIWNGARATRDLLVGGGLDGAHVFRLLAEPKVSVEWNGGLSVGVTGPAGLVGMLEESEDFTAWSPYRDLNLGWDGGVIEVGRPEEPQFFRYRVEGTQRVEMR